MWRLDLLTYDTNLIQEMKLILTIALFFFTLNQKNEDKVFICKGTASTKYHLKMDCKGLDLCTTNISTISKEKANDLKRTLCGWEKEY